MSNSELHIITADYPPQFGGVSDYTRIVAEALAAAGDEVHVWCPLANGETPPAAGVTVHRELGRLSPTDLHFAGLKLNRFAAPRRVLVQWVPHSYRYRSLNVPFCLWLWQRARFHGDEIEIMVHEPYLPFIGGALVHNLAAGIHRFMAMTLLNCARRVWVSIPAWELRLKRYTLGRSVPFEWLPIPSNVAVVQDPGGRRRIRNLYAANGQTLIGHFGTYGGMIKETLIAVIPELLRRRPELSVLLLGRRSEVLREELIRSGGAIGSRLHATGGLDETELSPHLSACDIMLQPYPDGVSTRRGSAMASLNHGLPLVTTRGFLTEPLWGESRAAALAPVGETHALIEQVHRLLDNVELREQLGAAAARLYQERFDVRHTVTRLRRRLSEPAFRPVPEINS